MLNHITNGNGIERSFFSSVKIKLGIGTAALMLFFACAPATIYNVDVRYVPTESSDQTSGTAASIKPVTVAMFRDVRNMEDTLVVGKVLKANGNRIPVLPRYTKPPEAVTNAVRDFLIHRGYTVSLKRPDWDLQNSSIDPSWGTILLGGTIKNLSVECDRSGPMKKYASHVGITVVLADVQQRRILHTITVDAAPTRQHIRFSEIMMEEEINRALSEAIERVFASRELTQKILNLVEPAQ